MNEPTGRERRVKERADVELDVDLGTYGKYFLSRLTNVSIGGAFVRTKTLHPIGTVVKLRFQLPGDTAPIEAAGSVVWVYDQPGRREPNSSGIGIRFTEISDESRGRIAVFVDSSKDF